MDDGDAADNGDAGGVGDVVDDISRSPEEWHRRGMRHPDDIAALVQARLAADLPADPTYRDFFGPSSRPRSAPRR